MHYAVPAGLSRAERLNRFYTDLWYPRLKPFLPRTLRQLSGFSRITGRSHPDIPTSCVKSCPIRGVRYAFDLQRAASEAERIRLFVQMGRWFAGWVTAQSDGKAAACYGYNSASLEWFESAGAQSRFKILEQTLVPRVEQKRLLAEEFRQNGLRWPDDEWNHLYEERERREWELADLIVCGSDFVKKALVRHGVDEDKIVVVPYGTPVSQTYGPAANQQNRPESFRLLFAGHGGIRKGLPWLFEALQLVSKPKIHLTIAGDVSDLPNQPKSIGDHTITYSGSVERGEIRNLMDSSDAFVFPSLCEGSATVIYEAMQAGLPVICTPNSGSVITHEHDGLIVPVKNPAKLSEAITTLGDNHSYRDKLRLNAKKTATSYTSESYSKRLLSVIDQYVG